MVPRLRPADSVDDAEGRRAASVRIGRPRSCGRQEDGADSSTSC